MTKRKLRKNADISPPQTPHEGIHTCSKGCTKCSRGLKETIEEQNQQIEALKRDVLEKTAELRKSEEHNEALCDRMQDLNSELFAASNINGKLHMKRVHDLNQMGGKCEEIARIKAELDRLKKTDPKSITDIDIQADPAWAIGVFRFHRQNDWAEIERLKRGADGIIRNICRYLSPFHAPQVLKEWHECKEGKPAV